MYHVCPCAMHARIAFVIAGMLSATGAGAQRTPRPPSDTSTLALEQLMNVEVVFAASRRAQRTRDVPSFVSIVTAADIKQHGYRTLADILKTLPSFYIANDRNYSYVGVRGFERAGDYNSRILLLQNGLRTNDNIYDAASLGEEFVIDVDLIERIEVIRGPSAALYGSNAFFAVINVVTKEGRSLNGSEMATSVASFGTHSGRATYGRAFGSDGDLLLSASVSDSRGQNLYFPEFDNPATNNGIAHGTDGERSHKLLATLSTGNFAFQASDVVRTKVVPTGSFGTLFNDPRAVTVDGISLASLSYNRSFDKGASFSTRLNGGHWTYAGTFPYDARLAPGGDKAVGDWWGVDVNATRAISRHFLTTGAEYRSNFKQNQFTFDAEPYFVYTDVHNHTAHSAVFVQDEIKLFQPLILYTGIRYDNYKNFHATSPRVGLIYEAGNRTTLKVLAGQAFRAPNDFELNYESAVYAPSPLLQPERIATLEVIAQRLIGAGVQVSASAFRNRLSALMSQQVDSNDNNRLVFRNVDEIESRGIELELRMNPGQGVTGQLSYALQKTEDRATKLELTNSPRQMAKGQLLLPLSAKWVGGFDAQYVSARRTLAGTDAHAFLVTNASLLSPRLFGDVDVSATIYNLFDVKYGVPGAAEVVQNIIQQDGRVVRAKATLHF